MNKLLATLTPLVLSHVALAHERVLSDLTIVLDDWRLIPTLDGTQVEGFLGLRESSQSLESNINAVWFKRAGQEWQAHGWTGLDSSIAMTYVQQELERLDLAEAPWTKTSTYSDASTEPPRPLGPGVFADDPLARVLMLLDDPQPILQASVRSGWPATSMPAQLHGSSCSQEQVLNTMAAMVEADPTGLFVADVNWPLEDCNRWLSLTAPLMPDGTWIVPDLSWTLESAGADGPGQARQSVAPGTRLQGTQSFVVSVGSGPPADDSMARRQVVIHLLDTTPPEITLDQDSIAEAVIGPTGVPYFMTPVEVVPSFTAIDAAQSRLETTLFYDGEPVTPGTTIRSPGIHTARLVAIDDSGNRSEQSYLFEIRDRPQYNATALLESVRVTSDTTGQHHYELTVLLASDAFDALDIHLQTMSMWLVDAEGNWLNDHAVFIENAYQDREYQPGEANAHYQDGYWRVTFKATHDPSIGTPSRIMIYGSGSLDEGGTFKYYTMCPLAEHPDPLQLLTGSGLTKHDRRQHRDDDPHDLCHWAWIFEPLTMDLCSRIKWTGNEGFRLRYCSNPTNIWGRGIARDRYNYYLFGNGGPYHAQCSSGPSGGTLRIFLNPENCCTDCEIGLNGRAAFFAHVTTDSPAYALAAGKLRAVSHSFDLHAKGGVESLTTLNLIGVSPLNLPFAPDSIMPPSHSEPFTDEANNTVPYCRADIEITTQSWGAVSANVDWFTSQPLVGFNYHAQANSMVYTKYFLLEAHPICVSGTASPPDEPIKLQY